MEIHCFPLLDIMEHVFDCTCSCGAFEDSPGFIMHNAHDHRQLYETGKRKYN